MDATHRVDRPWTPVHGDARYAEGSSSLRQQLKDRKLPPAEVFDAIIAHQGLAAQVASLGKRRSTQYLAPSNIRSVGAMIRAHFSHGSVTIKLHAPDVPPHERADAIMLYRPSRLQPDPTFLFPSARPEIPQTLDIGHLSQPTPGGDSLARAKAALVDLARRNPNAMHQANIEPPVEVEGGLIQVARSAQGRLRGILAYNPRTDAAYLIPGHLGDLWWANRARLGLPTSDAPRGALDTTMRCDRGLIGTRNNGRPFVA